MFCIRVYPVNIYSVIFNIILCNLLFISSVFATQVDKLVIARGNHSYPPYEIMSPDDKLTGLHIEMILAAAKQLGITVEFKSVPWKRALHMVKQGQVDAISYISKTSQRQSFAIFYKENILSHGNYVLFTLNEYKPNIHFDGQLTELQPHRIGTVMGYNYSPKLNQADYLMIDNQSKSEAILLKRLLNKHFHIGLADKRQISILAQEANVSGHIAYLSPTLFYAPQYIAFSRVKKHYQLARKFAQALQEFKQTPAYQDLLSKYILQNAHY